MWLPRLEVLAACSISPLSRVPKVLKGSTGCVNVPFLPPATQEISGCYMAVWTIFGVHFLTILSIFSPCLHSTFCPQPVQNTLLSGGVAGPLSFPRTPRGSGSRCLLFVARLQPSAAGKHSEIVTSGCLGDSCLQANLENQTFGHLQMEYCSLAILEGIRLWSTLALSSPNTNDPFTEKW